MRNEIPMSLKPLIAIYLIFNWHHSNAQDNTTYYCDKKYLNDEEYSKCLSDSAWKKDVLILTDYLSFLQKKLFPEFRAKRKSLIIPDSVGSALADLRKVYDSTLKIKLEVFKTDMYKNQKFVQPNAYISSTLILDLFYFYPDIYAVLLNPIHVELRPKTALNDLKQIELAIQKLLLRIPTELYSEIYQYSNAFEKQRNEYPYALAKFQGEIDTALKEKYAVVNFLLWNR